MPRFDLNYVKTYIVVQTCLGKNMVEGKGEEKKRKRKGREKHEWGGEIIWRRREDV